MEQEHRATNITLLIYVHLPGYTQIHPEGPRLAAYTSRTFDRMTNNLRKYISEISEKCGANTKDLTVFVFFFGRPFR